MSPPLLRTLLTFCLALFASGCPDAETGGGPVDTCTTAGEQCRIAGGQLGVCTMDTRGELTCAPQH